MTGSSILGIVCICFGLFAGLAAGYLRWGNTPAPDPVSSPNALTAAQPKDASADPSDPEKPQQEVKALRLNLNEGIVSGWERRFEELQPKISIDESIDGWTIHIRENDPLFSFTGLRDGEFISNEDMQDLMTTPEREGLVVRFLRILRELDT